MAGKNEPSLENHQKRVPMRMTSMRLELLSRHRIRDPGLGLNEPSGLMLNADGSALYTFSDDTKAIFRSDKGRCLFQYEWAGDTVLQRLDLTISTGDKPKQIRKPEGVAFDPGRKRMYVVSDRDADLYVFKLHDDC